MPDVSAIKFQSGLVAGLAANGAEIEILGHLPILPFPRNRTAIVAEETFTVGDPPVPGTLMAGINLPLLRLPARLLMALVYGRRKLRSTPRPDAILVYALHTPHLVAAAILARVYRVPFCVFIPDLPLHMAGRQLRGLRAAAKRMDDWLQRRLVAQASLAFPIAEAIATDWLPADVPHLVVEGVAQTPIQPRRGPEAAVGHRHARRTLLYTGTLSYVSRFATMLPKAREIDAQLVFMGGGPDRNALEALASRDARIAVRPFATGTSSTAPSSSTDFLLNPRDSGWEGARFSFPSKLHDYMARRRPIISTPLPGIPAEYFDCFLRVSDADISSFRMSLTAILEVA